MLCDFWARICIDWKQWESALCLRWDGDTSFIEPSQWQWIHFCQFVVIYQTKSNAFIQSKQKMMCLICKPQPQSVLIFQCQSIKSAHSWQWQTPNGCQKSGVTCEAGWDTESSSQAINQLINQSIRVVTCKSVRNVNDKIMEYKSSCCGTEIVKNHW